MSTPGGIDRLRQLIRDVPDFPQQGVLFKDITPVLAAVEELRKSSRYVKVLGSYPRLTEI